MRRLLAALLLVLTLVACAPPSDEKPMLGCGVILQNAWDLIEDPANYIDKPRPGRRDTGWSEPDTVFLAEGPRVNHPDEFHAYPPNSPLATRWSAIGAFRRFTYVPSDDANAPAVQEAGEFLQQASEEIVGPTPYVETPHATAKRVYERAFQLCVEKGKAPFYLNVIEVS